MITAAVFLVGSLVGDCCAFFSYWIMHSAWRYIYNYSLVFCCLSEYPFRFYISGLPSFYISSNKHHSTKDLRYFLYWVYASVVLGRQKLRISETRDYWIIYRGPGFLAVLWFGSYPTPSNPPPLPSVSSTGDTQELRKRYLRTGEGRKGMGEEPYQMAGPL